MNRTLLLCLVLFCGTTLLFARTRHHQFINFDDPGYVFDEHVQAGLSWQGARWAFTTFTFANYHPLTWLSHMTDVTLFGHDPAGHHLSSVFIHALNALLVYLVLRAMTRRTWESFAVAALWAVHPLRVESVAWVAERKDLLCAFFFFLSIGCYARYVRRGSLAAYAGSLTCFVLGLMSKSMVVTLPFVLLLLDLWPLRRQSPWKTIVLEKAPFFLMTVVFSILTVLAQDRSGAIDLGEHLPVGLRIANSFASLWAYVWTTLWPTGLAIFYPYHGALAQTRLPVANVVLGIALLIGGMIVGAATWRRERAVMVGWLWFVGMLVPVIGLVQVGGQARADRYTYLPHVGLLVAIVWGVATTFRGRGRGATQAVVTMAAVAFIALSLRTWDQLKHWRDSGTLFTHALRVTDRNVVAHLNLAEHLAQQGQPQRALDLVLRAIEFVPRASGPYHHAARIFGQLGRHEEAIRYGREAVRLDPDGFIANYELAVELAEQGRIDEALPHFERALQVRPEFPEAHYAHGLALRQAGDSQAADRALRRAADRARAAGKRTLLREVEATLADPAAGRRDGGENDPPALSIPATNPDNRPN